MTCTHPPAPGLSCCSECYARLVLERVTSGAGHVTTKQEPQPRRKGSK